MIMPARLRKFVLTAHVVSSVGWLGAVLAFIGVVFVALTSEDAQTVRGALLVVEPIGWYILLPLVVASLVTGIIQSLGTTWGLFRHYWTVYKLVIAVVSTIILVLFIITVLNPVTSGAANPASSVDQLRPLAGTPKGHALVALGGLLTATVLAVYKPRGMTQRGNASRKSNAARRAQEARTWLTVPPRPATTRVCDPTADRPPVYHAGRRCQGSSSASWSGRLSSCRSSSCRSLALLAPAALVTTVPAALVTKARVATPRV